MFYSETSPLILLVDEDNSLSTFQDYCLKHHSFGLHTVAQLNAVPPALEQNDYALIIINLSDRTAQFSEITEKILGYENGRPIPVIILGDETLLEHTQNFKNISEHTVILDRTVPNKILCEIIQVYLEYGKLLRWLKPYQGLIRNLTDKVEDLIFLTDQLLRIIFANKRFIRYTGLKSGDHLDESFFTRINPENPKILLQILEQLSQAVPYIEITHVFRDVGDNLFNASTTISRVLDDRGETVGYQWIIRKLPGANEVPAFQYTSSGATSHFSFITTLLPYYIREARDKIESAHGLVGLLRDNHLANSVQTMLGMLRKSLVDLLVVFRELENFTKQKIQPIHPEAREFVEFHLARELRAVVRVLKAIHHNKKIRFNLEIDPHLPVIVKGDPLKLQQIFLHLALNIFRHQSTKSLSIHVTPETIDEKRQRIKFTIKGGDSDTDHQPGKAPNHPWTYLEFFFTPDHMEYDFNLLVAHTLCLSLHGELYYYYTSHKVFTLSLPFEPVAFTRSQQFKKMNILLVDDNILNLQTVSTILSRQGFQCDMALNGYEACEKISSKHYDIILMDLQMPEMDGFDTTRLIRMKEKECGCEKKSLIVALTACSSADDVQRCFDTGMDGFLTKPFRFQDLVPILNKLHN